MRGEVLRVAAELIADDGVGTATVYAIARRAGVSNATIYREWPNRAALLAQAFEGVFPIPQERGPTTAPCEELTATLVEMDSVLGGGVVGRLLELQLLLGAGPDRDSFVAATLGRWDARIREIWRDGVAQGLFDGAVHEATVAEQFLAPIVMNSLLPQPSRVDGPIDGVTRRVDAALNGLRT